MLADATAIFAAGLISIGQGGNSSPFANLDLVAFLASFLLVHLGGPDTITTFALEDNELWLRHLLGLGFPCWAVVYALIQSFPKKELLIPPVLIFVAGLIKYIERTLSLYLATSHTIKESRPVELDLGPKYAKLIEVEMVPGRRPDEIDKHSELTDLMVLQNAYRLFNTFRGLTADLLFSSKDCQVSRCFFLERTSADAFKVVEAELNFFYDVLYTKATVVQGMLGYLVRMLLLSLDCTSVALFYRVEKKEFTNFDTGLTYTLLVGTLALDLIASIMVLKSYWTAVSLTKSEYPSQVIAILKMLLNVDKERWPKNPGKKPT
ncbi:hypothetical protein Vadar_022874 [Vaccinium darrowii]|uniref:Uncharacterized protein n=1 Tax=Vaccinium darrowii TaxID=229202 RepID=A0ACB7X362_9ERIC|nr:hypothetical protein Vadar_022874 [Vaccinium darrowii]